MGISRESRHKRSATGAQRAHYRKKRKFELGRQAASTKLGAKRVHTVRTRGGNTKFRALRLDSGNFAWGSEHVTKKTRIIGVVYNASNNELVRTNTLVKSAIILVDATPFRQWYESHYAQPVTKKGAKVAPPAETEEKAKLSNHATRRVEERKKQAKIDPLLESQFSAGRLYAAISSRPGQSGRADGYILEGKELEDMVKQQKKPMAPLPRRGVDWTPRMTMNMSDLSRDDDFLNHLLVEKLGTGGVPLYVHKMDPSRRLPKTDPQDLMAIVQRLIVAKGHQVKVIKGAVDELLRLHAVRTFIQDFPQSQIDAFATHASRYFELYLPTGSIEISHTSRYTHRTGKSELCILATRYLPPGTVVTELKGSMAKLSRDDEKQMKRNTDIRRDFSVIHSGQMKKNHLFLGPARFVNHDCENNCELFREGKYITFRTLRAIAIGEEITAHYGDGYCKSNVYHLSLQRVTDCRIQLAARTGTVFVRRQPGAEEIPEDESSDSSSDSSSDLDDDEEAPAKSAGPAGSMSERRTRRGVYHIPQRDGAEDSDSEIETGSGDREKRVEVKPDGAAIPEVVVKIEEKEGFSELSSLPPSRQTSASSLILPEAGPSSAVGILTPTDSTAASPAQLLPPIFAATPLVDDEISRTTTPTAPRSIITTRRQKAAAAASMAIKQQLVTPPPSVETSSLPDESISARRLTRAEKGKAKATAIDVDAEDKVTTRMLRTRPSAIVVPVGTPQMTEIPCDENGKQLPTCLTCHSILPIIHVDQEIVWGVGKKKEMKECPRCMRHFAIYGHPWPARTASQRALYMPTPREELTPVDSASRRVSAKALSTLDKKLAAAAKNPGKSRLRDISADEPPSKKRKLESGASASVKFKLSAKDKQALSANLSRSGRQSRPSIKAKEVEVKPKVKEPEVKIKRPVGRPRKHPLPVPPLPPPLSPSPPLRDHSMPSSPALKQETISAPVTTIKPGPNRNMRPYNRPNKTTVVQYQPRDGQGRFGKKPQTNGKYQRKQKFGKQAKIARRASEGTAVKLEEIEAADLLAEYHATEDINRKSDGDDNAEAPLRNINGRLRKRRKDATSESPQKASPKRVRLAQDSFTISIPRTEPLPAPDFSPTPKPVISLHRPNPMNLARPHWATQARRGLRGKPADFLNMDDCDTLELSSRKLSRSRTTQAGGLEVTEEGSQVADVEEREWRTIFPEELKMPAVGALTLRPSPGTFAKRRWSTGFWDSQPSSPDDSGASDDEDHADTDSLDTEVDFKKRFSIYYNYPSCLNDYSDDEVGLRF
ncbi:hypothetical protein HWV62_24438 [Athelia sp. TMB]|nr:hypothetical protein HWV62_24438 [Athelia sp. TMB]